MPMRMDAFLTPFNAQTMPKATKTIPMLVSHGCYEWLILMVISMDQVNWLTIMINNTGSRRVIVSTMAWYDQQW